MIGSQRFILTGNRDGMGCSDGAGPADQIDLVGFEKLFHTAAQLRNDLRLSFVDAIDIVADAVYINAERFAVQSGMIRFGCVQQCLGGDASAVETGAAYISRFDHSGGKTQLCCADGSHISAGSGADNG